VQSDKMLEATLASHDEVEQITGIESLDSPREIPGSVLQLFVTDLLKQAK